MTRVPPTVKLTKQITFPIFMVKTIFVTTRMLGFTIGYLAIIQRPSGFDELNLIQYTDHLHPN